MAKKYINWKTKGMNKDMSVSAFNPEFAFENLNIRLATNEGNTTMSWVNERGPKKLTLHIDMKPWLTPKYEENFTDMINGIPIGTAVLNHKLVLFTSSDHIYVFEKSKDSAYTLQGKILYRGSLGFSPNYPIETVVSYESENIQKVYWTDGLNQPRVINIAPAMDSKTVKYKDSSFDFVPELALRETVTVSKMYGAGEFPPGVIQYAFTYYNKYGQESNIFYTTPLQYISYINRAGSPEEKIANCFKIEVINIDKNFDYMRIYSILRTSKDGTPLVKRIQDLEIKESTSSLTYIDNGTSGETVDPTELLYKGGEEIAAKTIEQKDGALFLGNIIVKRPVLNIKNRIFGTNSISSQSPLANSMVEAITGTRYFKLVSKSPFTYYNTLDTEGNYQGAACFKSREYYRLGVQFQYKNGKWSEPCWIGDKQCNVLPSMSSSGDMIQVPEFVYHIDASIISGLSTQGYKKVRPVFAIPRTQDRTILCQGIGCPTMYREVDRKNNLYAVSSWLFRTKYSSDIINEIDNTDWNIPNTKNTEGDGYTGGGYVSSNYSLKSQYRNQFVKDSNMSSTVISPYLSSTEIMGTFNQNDSYFIDHYLITLNSPDIEFDDYISHTDFKGYNLSIVGYTLFEKTYGDISIQTSTPTIGSDAAGFVHRSIVAPGYGALISGLFYNDYIVDDVDDKGWYWAYNTSSPPIDYPVYMWHKNGSLNNDVARDGRSAQLLKKKISNYRLGSATTYYAIGNSTVIGSSSTDIQLFNSDTLSVIKVNGKTYQGNVDTMVVPSEPSPYYFVGNPWRKTVDTTYKTKCYYRLSLKNPNDTSSESGIWELKSSNNTWIWDRDKEGKGKDIGDHARGVSQWREGVSIKYKSTPHLVANIYTAASFSTLGQTPIIEVYKAYDKDIIFGGASNEALQAATWIPCGPPVSLNDNTGGIDLQSLLSR